jgi:predicted nucleic acid-binding protein
VSSYLDTSALAKLYLNELRSDEFESYLEGRDDSVISTLTIVEMRSLLARHRRMGQLEASDEARVFARFEEDIQQGLFLLRPLSDEHTSAAVRLIERSGTPSLRTLDALHIAVAQQAGADELATADRAMAAAAEELGWRVARFD